MESNGNIPARSTQQSEVIVGKAKPLLKSIYNDVSYRKDSKFQTANPCPIIQLTFLTFLNVVTQFVPRSFPAF